MGFLQFGHLVADDLGGARVEQAGVHRAGIHPDALERILHPAVLFQVGDVRAEEEVVQLPVFRLVLLVHAIGDLRQARGGLLDREVGEDEIRRKAVDQFHHDRVRLARVVAFIAADEDDLVAAVRVLDREGAQVHAGKRQVGDGFTAGGAAHPGGLVGFALGVEDAKAGLVQPVAAAGGVEQVAAADGEEQAGDEQHHEDPGKDLEVLVDEFCQRGGAGEQTAHDLGFHPGIKAGGARAEGHAAEDAIRGFAGEGAVGGAEDPQDGQDEQGCNTEHGSDHLCNFLIGFEEGVHFIERVVEVQGNPGGAGDLVGVEPGVHAVLPGADLDGCHLVEHDRDLVGIRAVFIEGEDAAAQRRVLRDR